MTEQAKMQPFKVLVRNKTGEATVMEPDSSRSLARIFTDEIKNGTHRIEHIRDQSALVEELQHELAEARAHLSLDRANIMAEINRGIDRWEGVPEILKVRIDAIDKLLSQHGRE